MNPFDMSHAKPLLDRAFAARVLQSVDAHVVRRRRRRAAAAGLALGCVVAAGVVIGIRVTEPTSRPVNAASFAKLDNRAIIGQADALGFMFPDAASLANFDNTYFVADSDGGDILSTDTADNDPG